MVLTAQIVAPYNYKTIASNHPPLFNCIKTLCNHADDRNEEVTLLESQKYRKHQRGVHGRFRDIIHLDSSPFFIRAIYRVRNYKYPSELRLPQTLILIS